VDEGEVGKVKGVGSVMKERGEVGVKERVGAVLRLRAVSLEMTSSGLPGWLALVVSFAPFPSPWGLYPKLVQDFDSLCLLFSNIITLLLTA
jgi:hypothetical protein